MIFLVPILSVALVKVSGRFTRIPSGTLTEKAVEHVTTGFLFSQVLPYFWNKIDDKAHRKMIDKAAAKNKSE